MKAIWKILPWFCLALFGIEIVAVMMPKGQGEFHTAEFGRLPVLLNGPDSAVRFHRAQRASPDPQHRLTVPWNSCLHGNSGACKKLKATEWVLEVMTRADVADTRPIFLIHHPDLLGELKLEGKGVEKSGCTISVLTTSAPGWLTSRNKAKRRAK
jgi:hypothetical protein